MASLKRPLENQILSAQDMYSFLTNSNFSDKIKFFFVCSENVEKVKNELAERFREAKTVKGTQKFHRITPIYDSIGMLKVHKLSNEEGYDVTSVKKNLERNETGIFENIKDFFHGMYVACVYVEELWFAMIEETSEEFGDILLTFQYPKEKSGSHAFPSKSDKCWVHIGDVVKIMKSPNLQGARRIRYCFNQQEMEDAV